MFSRTLLELGQLEFHFNNWNPSCSSILKRCDKFVTLGNLRTSGHSRTKSSTQSGKSSSDNTILGFLSSCCDQWRLQVVQARTLGLPECETKRQFTQLILLDLRSFFLYIVSAANRIWVQNLSIIDWTQFKFDEKFPQYRR